MEYRYIGKTGLKVSSVCMGTMTFGLQNTEDEAFSILDEAYNNSINFYDTAEIYPVPPRADVAGDTEIIVGKWLKTKPRDSVIIASKVAGAAAGWFVPPIRHGLTAIDSFHIVRAVEGSLKRMQTDYIDLYQVHWPDPIVPIEESLKALDMLVRSGKVRYIGTSNDNAYGLTKADCMAKQHGYARFESIQNNFSLLQQRFLDELALVCKRENISLLPYSPLAGGVLSGKYSQTPPPENARFSKYIKNVDSRVKDQVSRFVSPKSLSATEKYCNLAKENNIAPVALALAWTLQFDFVASSIIGATSVEQLKETLTALKVHLTPEILKKCKTINEEFPLAMG